MEYCNAVIRDAISSSIYIGETPRLAGGAVTSMTSSTASGSTMGPITSVIVPCANEDVLYFLNFVVFLCMSSVVICTWSDIALKVGLQLLSVSGMNNFCKVPFVNGFRFHLSYLEILREASHFRIC